MMKPIKKINFPLSILAVMTFGFQANAPAEFYRYDVIGRLIKVSYDNGSGISYTYDHNGNLLSVQKRVVASDINANGRVELSDFARLQRCFADIIETRITPACASADLDGNGTVDLNDFEQFQSSLTGP